MGNVNGREDGGGGSGVDSQSGGGDMAADGGELGDGEFMGPSPPSSPRAARSPLMFTPQAPVVPLQRPDEIHIPSPSWMQTTSGYEDMSNKQGIPTSGYEDMSNKQGIPTMITWSYDGKEVAVEGSWDDWKSRNPLQRSGKDFSIMKVLPSGVYQYRFIVDGQWRHSPDMPWTQDDAGNAYNILDLLEYVPEDIESISGFEPPQSPDSSYNNLQLGAEDFAKEPPMVPPHLQMTLLNVPSCHTEIPPPSRPQHVVLNHLYMQKGRSSPLVVALGSTHRFKAKYVTVVLYKSTQR